MTEQEFYKRGMERGYTKLELLKIIETKESIESEGISVGGFEDLLPPQKDRIVYTREGMLELKE